MDVIVNQWPVIELIELTWTHSPRSSTGDLEIILFLFQKISTGNI